MKRTKQTNRLIFFILIFLASFILLIVWKFALNEVSDYKKNIELINEKDVRLDLIKARVLTENTLDKNRKNIQFLSKILEQEFKFNDTASDIRRHIEDFAETYNQYFQVRILDSIGFEKIRLEISDSSSSYFLADSLLQFKGDRYYFKECKLISPDDIYFSKLDLNIELGRVERPFKPTYRICKSMHLNGNFYGMIILNFKASKWLDMMASDGVFVINDDNQFFDVSAKEKYELNSADQLLDTAKFIVYDLPIDSDLRWKLAKEKVKSSELIALYQDKVYFFAFFISFAILLGAILTGYFISSINSSRAQLKYENFKLIEVNKKLAEATESIHEKDLLIKEIHHRVKNNLQIISSITALESFKYKDEAVKNSLKNVQSRILSMSIVHELLYQQELATSVNIKEFIYKLTQHLITSDLAHNIELEIDVIDVDLNLNTAIPIGLILNEIITNSVKYAFPNQGGHIYVRIQREPDGFGLEVGDNGIGFSTDTISKSLGTKLIDALVKQLSGNYELLPKKGTHYRIFFKEA